MGRWRKGKDEGRGVKQEEKRGGKRGGGSREKTGNRTRGQKREEKEIQGGSQRVGWVKEKEKDQGNKGK